MTRRVSIGWSLGALGYTLRLDVMPARALSSPGEAEADNALFPGQTPQMFETGSLLRAADNLPGIGDENPVDAGVGLLRVLFEAAPHTIRTMHASSHRSSGERRNSQRIAIVVVDHGSTRCESNQLLNDFVEMFQATRPDQIVEPAHMELAEPSIRTAFDRCVRRGADCVVVAPYFLAPGKHWNTDIPALAAQAAARHPGVTYLITAPIGLHPLMCRVIQTRIAQCLVDAQG